MHPLLRSIETPEDFRDWPVEKLDKMADEIRDVLTNLVATRTAHYASNLGVVELCLALHSVYDFRSDRLIWDTGHQVYPHKLVTGRYKDFGTMRTRGGLMGYPNPNESEYDLFMTGHAGASVSTVMGLRSGDELLGEDDRHSVAVIGDGAFPSGMVYEAMNNVGHLQDKLLVILNDNKMSICPRVGGVGKYLDKLRTNPFYTGLKTEIVKTLNKVPVLGDPAERFLAQLKEGVKAGLHGGMLFEDLGFRYIGPIDGHDIGLLKKYLKMVKTMNAPVLLHVVTEKGHGVEPAAEDPVLFHTPPVIKREHDRVVPIKKNSPPPYTTFAREAIKEQITKDKRVVVLTAAMCQGNKLEPVRAEFPKQFFDVGICEGHAVAFAGGQAKAGLRPIVDIYSTFLQRSYDQIFQEVALQNLPVTFMLDRAGLTGPDGATHHGVFDLGYMRIFPNMVVMAPGDGPEIAEMLDFALNHDGPCSLRYPKTTAEDIKRDRTPIELGKAEVISWGTDAAIVCCGTQLADCMSAAEVLRNDGLSVGVINARFVKPIDREVMRRALTECSTVVTVEEGALAAGFGSALTEFAADEGLDVSHVRRLGLPDQFIEHGERSELLADFKLDSAGIVETVRTSTSKLKVAQ